MITWLDEDEEVDNECWEASCDNIQELFREAILLLPAYGVDNLPNAWGIYFVVDFDGSVERRNRQHRIRPEIVYIGCSVQIKKRWNQHRELKGNLTENAQVHILYADWLSRLKMYNEQIHVLHTWIMEISERHGEPTKQLEAMLISMLAPRYNRKLF